MKTISVACETCGKMFGIRPKEYNRKKRSGANNFYCSKQCYSTSRIKHCVVKRHCLFCGMEFQSSSHKKHKKCCSIECARKYSKSHVNLAKLSSKMKMLYSEGKITIPNPKQGPHKLTCLACGSDFMHDNKKKLTCSTKCQKVLQKLGGRNGGIKSAQSQQKRSKNEILFCEMCKRKFQDTVNNLPMFNGWDADVIIPSLKIAVLWNGVWHRKKITISHSVKQVKNRDLIKIKEIKACGYTPYVIEDDGSFDIQFVQKEFDKFTASVAR